MENIKRNISKAFGAVLTKYFGILLLIGAIPFVVIAFAGIDAIAYVTSQWLYESRAPTLVKLAILALELVYLSSVVAGFFVFVVYAIRLRVQRGEK